MSAAAAIGTRVKELAAVRAVEREAAYWEMVRECGRPDSEPDPDKVAAWLLAESIDVEKFNADLETVAKRFEARALLDRLPDVQAKRNKLWAEFEAAGAVFGKAQEAFAAVADRINPLLKVLDDELNRGPSANSLLVSQCPYAHLRAQDAAIGRELVEMEHRERELRGPIHTNALGDAAQHERDARSCKFDADREPRLGEAAAARERAAGYLAEADAIARRRRDLLRARDELNVRMQEP